MSVHRMSLTTPEPTAISYEEVVSQWKAKKHDIVFTGNFLLNFVTYTNQIEGIDISFNTTRELFENEQVSNYSGDLRNLMSVLNNRRVADYMNAQLGIRAPITPDFIKEVHRLLLFASMDRHRYEDNNERAGEYKKKDYCVGRFSVGATPEEAESYITDLCDVLAQTSTSALKLATIFQCYFENIHPFADGNGRVGRWITNYLLVLHGNPPVLFTRDSRQDYFKALELFDASEDLYAMEEYLKKQTVQSYSALREL